MPDYTPLWYWIKEREQIRIKKERNDWQPWTNDPILKQYRFCNVRREDDRVTIWIRKNIREHFNNFPYLWLMLCIARQINWPDTLNELIEKKAWPVDNNFNPYYMTNILDIRKARGDKVYTGAYVISASPIKGTSKNSYIAEQVIGDLWKRQNEFQSNNANTTLQQVHSQLLKSNGWGNFMAYQAVVDMRFTRLLNNASDIKTWASAGPGTLRGLNRMHNRDIDYQLKQDQALDEMQAIYELVQKETEVLIDFSDIPNILCETDKYLRLKLGQGRTRALYVEGRGS